MEIIYHYCEWSVCFVFMHYILTSVRTRPANFLRAPNSQFLLVSRLSKKLMCENCPRNVQGIVQHLREPSTWKSKYFYAKNYFFSSRISSWVFLNCKIFSQIYHENWERVSSQIFAFLGQAVVDIMMCLWKHFKIQIIIDLFSFLDIFVISIY